MVNSLLSAAAFGMATGLLERVGLDAMLPQVAPRTGKHLVERAMNVAGARLDQAVAQLPPKIQTAINTLRAAAVEGATEYAENPIQGALEGIAKNEDAAQIWGRALEGAKDWTPILYAGIMGGGMRAIAGSNPGTEQPAIDLAGYPPEQRGVAAAIAEVAGQEAEAGQRLALGEALSRAAEVGDATKLKGKSREAFEAAYGNLVPQDVRIVFLDPQSLTSFAQGEYARSQEPVQEEGPAPTMPPDTPAQLSQLGLTVEQVQAAKASGAPVEVPLVRILSMPAGPERAALLDAVRQKPDGLTGEEARLFNPAEQLDAAALRLAERREQSRALRAEESRLRQEFMGAGFPAHVAERYTALQRANAEAFRARYGVDPVATLRNRSFARGEQAQGDAALAQAMYRNNAATLQGFVDEVLAGTPQDKKSYFGLGTAGRTDLNIPDSEIILASDQVRHIKSGHPDFNAWSAIPEVIVRGGPTPLAQNKVTGGRAIAFTLNEGKESLVVVAAPQEGKFLGRRLVVLTAFRDSAAKVENWLEQNKGAAFYQSAGGSPAYPSPRGGDPSALKSGSSDKNISLLVPESKPFAQDQGTQERRGQVDFQTTPEGEVQALVTLFDSKDLSTVLHESTHIFTRQLEEIAGQGNEAAAADVRALREWAGVSPEGPLTPEEYRSFQEAVATAGEAYFMGGKAPSAKLRRVFAGFRDWLLNIYKNMRAIFSSAGFENHRLTDDVRAVFDRMLTTDDILSRSRERMDLLDGAARVNAELPLEDQAELDARLAEAAEDAVIAMNKATLRDRQKRLHEYRDIARTAVGQEQFWETVDYLSGKTGPGLDRQALEREYGKEAVRELSRARRGLVRENGLPLDLAAQEMDWQDTDALWNALYDRLALQGQSKRGQIEDMAQAMLAGDDSLREQSVDQMAGDAYGDYLDALDKSLGKLLAKKRAPTPESVKRLADSLATPRKVLIFQAQEQISRSRVSDIRPDTYNAALRKGQRRLQQALRKGDLVESLELLNAARLSNELYVQAVKARKQIEAVTRRARKAAAIKPDKIDSLAREGLRRIMERFSLARMPEGERDSAAESLSLREIINALNPDADLIMESDGSQAQAEGQNILADAFPEWLLNEAAPLTDSGPARNRNALPYGELTLTQLEDVNELVSHLEHAGRAMNRASRESEAARIEAQAVEAAAPMQGLKPVSIAEEGSAREKWQRLSRKFLSEHESLSSIFLRADGFSNIGPKGKAGVNEQELLQPLLDGENQKKLLWRDISTRMADQGARPVLEGLGKLLRPGALDLVRDIESVSPYMESRSRNIDRDLAQGVTDMAKQAKQRKLISLAGAAHTVEQVADVGLAPMRCMDMAVSSALWIGAYNAKMRELNPGGKAGIDTSSEHHKAAVDHADKMVKRSNPDYDATSRTKFMRDPGYSWFNMFSSAVEMIFQRQRLALQAVQAGKLSAPQYARYQLYDMILPATAFYLMGEAMTAVFGSDDDKKKRDKKNVTRRYLEALADYAAPVIPVAGPALSSWFINGRQSQGRNVLDKPVRLGLKVGDKARALADPKLRGKKREKAERALAFSIIDLGGFFARIPVQRFAKYGEKVGNALGE